MAGCRPRRSQGKSGRKLNHGYVLILMPNHPRADVNGYVREHILIMEDALQCCLLPSQVIHHINGNRSDNRLENLQVMTRSEHSSLHKQQEQAENYEYRKDWRTIWRARRKDRRMAREEALRAYLQSPDDSWEVDFYLARRVEHEEAMAS